MLFPHRHWLSVVRVGTVVTVLTQTHNSGQTLAKLQLPISLLRSEKLIPETSNFSGLDIIARSFLNWILAANFSYGSQISSIHLLLYDI